MLILNTFLFDENHVPLKKNIEFVKLLCIYNKKIQFAKARTNTAAYCAILKISLVNMSN